MWRGGRGGAIKVIEEYFSRGVVSVGVREISFSDGSRSWTSVAICFVSNLTSEALRFCEVDKGLRKEQV